MISAPTGVLLPASTLNSTWFTLLATFVAFNTIIYVGLTLSKLIPWPRQFHPRRVRRLLGLPDPDTSPEVAMLAVPVPDQPESDDPYEAMRRGIARRDIPQAFALAGGLVILLAIASIVAFTGQLLAFHVTQLMVGVVMLLTSQILGRGHFRAWTMMWVWCVACVLIVALLIVESRLLDSQLPLTYSLIVMTAFAPVMLAWRPSMVAAVLMLGCVVAASLVVNGSEDLRIIATAASALVVSGVLLHMRLNAVDALSDEKARSFALATTDNLTGALTRQGLLTLMPGLGATAERAGQEVCVMRFDIDQLSRANADYGLHYGDDVLRAVSKAIHETVRQGDLVARWGEDEFLVAGLGNRPDAEAMGKRIALAVQESGINLGKWPTTVTVGTAAGDPAVTTFDILVQESIPLPNAVSRVVA